MPIAKVLLLVAHAPTRHELEHALQAAKFEVVQPPEGIWQAQGTSSVLSAEGIDLIIADPTGLATPTVAALLEKAPYLPVVLFATRVGTETLMQAVRHSVVEVLTPPVRYENLREVLRRALARQEVIRRWVLLEAQRHTQELRLHLDELQTLLRVGRALTSELDLDTVLGTVVHAAVELTGAEESTLLLLDEASGELLLRASYDFKNGINTLRLKVEDTLAGSVVRSGQAVVLDQDTPEKIKTSYLVQSLIYVPLYIHGHIIGVLGVDNREQRAHFTQRDVARLTALAEYAAVALDNAQLFAAVNAERRKLETVLQNIKEGVLVLNAHGETVLVNNTARMVLEAPADRQLIGRNLVEICRNAEVEEGAQQALNGAEYHTEITLSDGRVFSMEAVPIPNVGVALTFYDITHFKELDRIKSEFVSAVSHDLRSPLTAILGYVDLLSRAGPLNPMQNHFIERVRLNVENITNLINDLLDLGRIEAGFDAEKTPLDISTILRYAIDGWQPRAQEKRQQLVLHLADNLPLILGHAVRLRQMLDNLIGNAVKYTPEGGLIEVIAESRGDQVIIRVRDNGPGIPPSEQPYIFNKFFRGSNVASEQSGTGLGLAIVKSIVENHHGRIWVDSEVGKGTTFTVVLPGLEEGSAGAIRHEEDTKEREP